jgi:hypothetical protein
MKASQLVRDLQHRLSSLLEDPVFAKARQDRAAQRVGGLEDAVIAHNMAMSEEILRLNASSVNGAVKDRKIVDFRKHVTAYLGKNSTGSDRYGDESCDHYHQRVYRVATGPNGVTRLLQVPNDEPMGTPEAQSPLGDCSR